MTNMSNSEFMLIWSMVLSLLAICLTMVVGVIAVMAYARLYSTHQVQYESLDQASDGQKFSDLIDEDGESPDFQDIQEAAGMDMDGRPIGNGPTGGELVKNLAEVYGHDPRNIDLDPYIKKAKEESDRTEEI